MAKNQQPMLSIDSLVGKLFASPKLEFVEGIAQSLWPYVLWKYWCGTSTELWEAIRKEGKPVPVSEEKEKLLKKVLESPAGPMFEVFLDMQANDARYRFLFMDPRVIGRQKGLRHYTKQDVRSNPRQCYLEALRTQRQDLLRMLASDQTVLQEDPSISYRASIVLDETRMMKGQDRDGVPELNEQAVNRMVDWNETKAYWYINLAGSPRTMEYFVNAITEKHPSLKGQESEILEKISRYHQKDYAKSERVTAHCQRVKST